jgi:hypothetical protein
MAKKQTRRSISVSRTTYERLKAFCEVNNISMSQLVETRVNDFLGEGATTTTIAPRPAPALAAPNPTSPVSAAPRVAVPAPMIKDSAASARLAVPMTSAAARHAIEPPPPIIKPKQEPNAPKPAEKRADQIFTF